MKHNVKIIYPGQKTFEFTRFSNGDMDLFFKMLTREWMHKSGNECAMFKDSNIRSFCNNDFIQVDDTVYLCTVYGMKEVSKEFLDDVEDRIRNHKYYERSSLWAKLEIFDELEKESTLLQNIYNKNESLKR